MTGHGSGYLRSAALALLLAAAAPIAGCAAADDDADPGDADPASGAAAVTERPCLSTDTTLFFHGLSGYGRELAQSGLCVPKIANSGEGGFWSDYAFTPAPSSTVVGGYSAGRIPLLRRLAKGEGPETTAVMLDPSYADGPRFEGRTGPSIVDAWLAKSAERRFVLVYLPSSAGWREFAALARGAHAEQVKVCAVTGTHLGLPALVTAKLFTSTDAWLAERCAD